MAHGGTACMTRPRPRRRSADRGAANGAAERPALPPGDDVERALAAWRMMLKEVAAALVSLRHMAIRQGEERLAEKCAPLILELMDVQERLAAGGAEQAGREGDGGGAGVASASVDDLLTARERECLRWCAAGKTYWETALILGIAERTVDFHMQSARRKLKADSNAACVARALLLGLL